MGHFPKKIHSPLAPKLLVRLKKSRGCKNGTNILYLQAKFGGDASLHGGGGEKQKFGVFCLFVCLFVTLWILNRGLVIQIAILSPFVGQF